MTPAANTGASSAEVEAALHLAQPDAAPPVSPLAVEAHLELLQRELDQMRQEIELLRRRDEALQVYTRRLDEELRLAARVQRDFLPKLLPQVGELRFHTLFRPAGHVSGDLYDVMRLDESHIGFYMADAVGHGMPAALLTMFLKQALVTKIIDPSGYRLLAPSVTMRMLNDALVAQNLSEANFATALYGHVNYRTRRLTFARGGHPEPILITRDGEVRKLEAEGGLLGIFPGDEFMQTAIDLEPGDRVFVYSDGVELAFGDTGTPDPAHWRNLLHERRHLPTEQIFAEARVRLTAADAQSDRAKDDLTVIAIEVQC